ncbi:MAG: glucosaminidase domain-containing protein [Pseudohongiella sp.]|uniref:glucosaminidase domain-containing protein n=1 Tax=Pseudohongiella sp. TaxID=1979412 RepID=UPI00349FE2C0
MLDLLRHPRLPALVRVGTIAAAAIFTLTAFAQYHQTAVITHELVLQPQPQPVTSDVVMLLPDFEAVADTDKRKEAFFAFLHAHIEEENERVRQTRSRLLPLAEIVAAGEPLSAVEQAELDDIVAQYKLADTAMSDRALMAELLRRVDIVPMSLVMAQAANESAWGTSRFAREGNNIFGQWCFDEGCGLVPERRRSDASHEVRSFGSVQGSVRAYLRNLNTHASYAEMRDMRADMRAQGRPLDSMVLARGLTQYSARGMAYVSELQDIIRVNRLHAFDRS